MVNKIVGAMLVMAVAVGSGKACFARLGETEAEIEKRYGRPYSTDDKPEGAVPTEKQLYFTKDNVTIIVTICRGRCVCENYIFKDGDGNDMHVKDAMAKAKVLLQANASGSAWEVRPPQLANPPVDFLWERSDGKAVAMVFRENPQVLEVMDLAFMQESMNQDKQQEAGLGGF